METLVGFNEKLKEVVKKRYDLLNELFKSGDNSLYAEILKHHTHLLLFNGFNYSHNNMK